MIIFKTNKEEYTLRLTTKGCVSCEKRLGKNPLNVFMEANENRLPKISDLMVILHECLLPANHGIKLEDVYDLYDDFCADGKSLMDLIDLLVQVFTDAGFLPKEEDGKN